jgi:hypothetical protein
MPTKQNPATPGADTQTIIALRREAQHVSWMLRHLTATPRNGWRQHAACRGTNTDLWYSDDPRPAECLSVCRTCPVRIDCGADAWAEEQACYQDIYGVRAGMSPTTRRRLYRKLGHRL